MPKGSVNREEQGKLLAQTIGVISMINESNYIVRSTSGDNAYTVTATHFGWACSCRDYASHNAKCKHVYAVEFYRSQGATS